MVLGYHIIFCAYGFWLPNDPRGSWSDFIRAWELLRFGDATTTDTRRSVAHQRHDATRRRDAKRSLRYPPVAFTGVQARAIGEAFARAAAMSGYTVFACSVLPDHVHLVVGRHVQPVEQILTHFKSAATRRLRAASLHPFKEQVNANGQVPACWAQSFWSVYLNDAADFVRAIGYVERNPIRDGLPRQRWTFVTPWAESWIDVLRTVRRNRRD